MELTSAGLSAFPISEPATASPSQALQPPSPPRQSSLVTQQPAPAASATPGPQVIQRYMLMTNAALRAETQQATQVPPDPPSVASNTLFYVAIVFARAGAGATPYVPLKPGAVPYPNPTPDIAVDSLPGVMANARV